MKQGQGQTWDIENYPSIISTKQNCYGFKSHCTFYVITCLTFPHHPSLSAPFSLLPFLLSLLGKVMRENGTLAPLAAFSNISLDFPSSLFLISFCLPPAPADWRWGDPCDEWIQGLKECLHTWTHNTCGCLHTTKTATVPARMGGVHEAPSLSEKLLGVGICWGRWNPSLGV